MLVLKDTEKLNSMFAGLLTDFRRVQVSRFPIEVVAKHENYMVFTDSRFPTSSPDVNKILGSVYSDDKGRVVVESRLIQNDKYSSTNSDYRTRKTSDVKKVLKYMREYIKPYTALEIASKTLGSAERAFNARRDELGWEVNRHRIQPMDIHEELLNMKMLGYVPKNPAVLAVMNEGMERIEEYKRIRNTDFPKVHVYIAPDESVTVAVMAKHVNMELGATTFESLAASPTYVQQHVGMLRMVDKDTHVPDVGYKSSDTEFWLEGFSQ